jgi:hypothetical protein
MGALVCSRELKELIVELEELRRTDLRKRLPNELKTRFVQLWKSGVSFAAIRKATGIQRATICSWAKILSPDSVRRFRILKVSSSDAEVKVPNENCLSGTQKNPPTSLPVVFRYENGKTFLEVFPHQLTSELMKVLVLC